MPRAPSMPSEASRWFRSACFLYARSSSCLCSTVPSTALSGNFRRSSATWSPSAFLPPSAFLRSGNSAEMASTQPLALAFPRLGPPMLARLSLPATTHSGLWGSNCSAMPLLGGTPKRSHRSRFRTLPMAVLSFREVNTRWAPFECAKKRSARHRLLRCSGVTSFPARTSHFAPRMTRGTGKGCIWARSACPSKAARRAALTASTRFAPVAGSLARASRLLLAWARNCCSHLSRLGSTLCGSDRSTTTASTRLPALVAHTGMERTSAVTSVPLRS
mmetsp:Transcript_116064/g.315157  ORF Transcript_116064/g.315157 Transcript_116064/m.315157 type:complete len:275 (+) Transcript_116064:120-944(+)